MSENDPILLPKLFYYLRANFYSHAEHTCTEGLQPYSNDLVLKFFRSYSIIMQDRVQEGMRDLDLLKDKRDVNLCSLMALILGHKKSNSVDKDAVAQYDAKLKEERRQAGELGLYYAGLFLFHVGKMDKAREYNDRMLKMNPTSRQGLVLKGWINLLCGKDAFAKKSIKFFDEASELEGGARDVDLLLGKAKYLEMRHNFRGALELINQVIVAQTNFVPALVEKMRLQLALMDWEQCLETAQRALDIDRHCIEAVRYQVLHILCKDGNYNEASEKIGEVIQLLDRFEPRNATVYKDISQLFARLCGRQALVLQQTCTMMERAVSIDNENAATITELGHQLLMCGKLRDATKCYKNAMNIDETSVAALTGLIHCQLLANQLDEASQQLDFLNELQSTMGKSAELCYLSSMMAAQKQQGSDLVIKHLNTAIETHFAGLKGIPMGIEYLLHLNPDFLLAVLKDYLQFAPQQPCGQGQVVDPLLKKCMQALDPVTRAVTGLLDALYLMGKVKYLSGDIDAAQSTLQHCLDNDPSFTDAHILMAQIHLYQNNFKLANQSLEVGLSHNFEVRNHPVYHLIKARIDKKQLNYAEAIKTLQIAMALPGVKKTGRQLSAGKMSNVDIGVNDRVSVFLELAEAHRLVGEQHEAARVMESAIQEFRGTSEEVRISIANVDLALGRGDVEMALGMLRNITPDQPYFIQAREKMAHIYLHHKKDKRLYASCYRELVDKFPSPHTCLLLGDAYMSILEPDRAIEVYETALKKTPRDPALASKIGQAYIMTHNYGKAISYYEAALKSGGQSLLRYDLAELLLKLRQYGKAEKVLKQAMETDGPATDVDGMMEHTKYLTLLYQVFDKVNKMDDASLSLTKARDMQAKVLKRIQVEQPDNVTTQKQVAAGISCKMAEHAVKQKDYLNAIKGYKEALVYNEQDNKVRLDLAQLYLNTDDLDACQHELFLILQLDKDNDVATIMLADLMLTKSEFEQAMHHYQQLLERCPDNYQALSRLVDLMRRVGKLDELTRYLDLAEKSSHRAPLDAGFNYCKALYEWYVGNQTEALRFFNKARKDSHWGNMAVYNMIEICLNPDNDTIGGEVFESDDVENHGSSKEKADTDQMALRTAEKLLRELKCKPGDQRPMILQNKLLIASKNKQKVESALASFLEIMSQEGGDQENMSCVYGLATGYMILKQTPRARNQLKRVVKRSWNIHDADDLEKCWLLLADIYIQSAKFDLATELLKKTLQHNKSCCKAYEYMGYTMEKDQAYKDAVFHYENAWKFGQKNNPVIGYKLAFNYMKAKRYMDAIDVCHHVLRQHPNYPKIRKDILDKARLTLRP